MPDPPFPFPVPRFVFRVPCFVFFLLFTLILIPAVAVAGPNKLDSIVARAVRHNYESLHGCYRQALAVDRNKGGTIFFRITLGAKDRVLKARVERDQLKHPGTVACMRNWIRGWTLPGAAAAGATPGSDLVIPLTFRSVPTQFLVRVEDAPTVKVGQKIAVRPLLSAGSVGARRASLSTLSVVGKMWLPHDQGVDQLLYVLLGKGSLSAGGRKRWPLRKGTAVWIPAGGKAQISGSLEAIQLFLPPGSEQRYREGPPGPGKGARRPLVRQPRRVKRLRMQQGKLVARPLFFHQNVKHRRFYLGLLTVRPGASMPAHAHLEAELVYVLSGKGKVTVDGTTRSFGPGHAIHLGSGSRHSVQILEATTVLQLYAPGGPERRYFGTKRKPHRRQRQYKR